MTRHTGGDSLRAVFAGRRGRLLAGLLLDEFAAAIQIVAYTAVLPLAARELSGASLYGATVAAGALTMVLVLAAGPGTIGRLDPRRALVVATGLYLAGVLFAALAPAMGWMLAGSVMRGLASGLFLGVGLTAIGGMYEDALRPRVLGLFALMWLLPSFAGPVLNAVIAAAFGWRWAMAWPAVLVLMARLLVIRDAGLIPWRPQAGRLEIGNGLWVVAGLILASAASGFGGSWSAVPFGAGVLIALLASGRVLDAVRRGVDRVRRGVYGVGRARVVRAFFGLCLAFFGAQSLITLAIIEGLGRGVVAASVALGAGLVAWSLTGLRPGRADERLGDAATLGLALLTVALAALAAVSALGTSGGLGATAGLGVAVGAFGVAGVGMGLAYPRLTAEAFDALPAELASRVAMAVGFAEVTGTAVGSLLGGGLYSLAGSLGVDAGSSISAAFAVLTAAAATAGLVSARRGQRARTPAGAA